VPRRLRHVGPVRAGEATNVSQTANAERNESGLLRDLIALRENHLFVGSKGVLRSTVRIWRTAGSCPLQTSVEARRTIGESKDRRKKQARVTSSAFSVSPYCAARRRWCSA